MSDLTRKQCEIMRRLQVEGAMYYMDDFPYSSYWFFNSKIDYKMTEYNFDDIRSLKKLGLIECKMFESEFRITGIVTLTEKGKEWKYESWFERAKKWFE